MHKPSLHFESLESRIAMTITPATVAFSIDPAASVTATVGQPLELNADEAEFDSRVQQVKFFLDNGDGLFDAALDQLMGVDDRVSDGWQFSPQSNRPYQIMPLGDSITSSASPHPSYRFPLWQKLTEAGYDFDFVGSLSNTSSNADENELFDSDHEGHWGWRTDQVLAQLPNFLRQNTPDIVLLHLGTNDLIQGQSVSQTLSELTQIVDQIRSVNPNVVVLAAQLLPTAYASNPLIEQFNAALPSFVEQWNSVESPVVLVDQNSAINSQTDLRDGVHPNAVGSEIMADLWFESLQRIRPLPDPAATLVAGQHGMFAVAFDDQGQFVAQRQTTLELHENESIVGVNVSGEIWVARSNGRTLDTTFVGAMPAPSSFSHIDAGDVNGDGIEDIVGRQTNGQLVVALGKVSGRFTIANWGSLTNIVEWSEFHVADFTGDGLADIAGRAASDGTWWLAESRGNAFTNSYWGRFPKSIDWHFVVGDFDGDGKNDISGRAETDGTWWTGISHATGFQNRYWGRWGTHVDWFDIVVGDFNGDNKDDIAGRANNSYWWMATSTGGAFATRYWTSWNQTVVWEDVSVGDFNGDGVDDVAGRANGQWWVITSQTNSRALFRNQYWGYWTTNTTWSDVRVLDLNGDGRDDIIGRAANGEWWNFESHDSERFRGVFVSRWAANAEWQHVDVGRF